MSIPDQLILPYCPDCYAVIDEEHHIGCEVARCKECGSEALWCDNMHEREVAYHTIWTGMYPLEAECRELGLWCYYKDGKYIECSPDHPEAYENISLLLDMFARGDVIWDKERERLILPDG